MTPIEAVRTLLDSLPEDVTVEDIQYCLFVIETLRREAGSLTGDDGATPEQFEKGMSKSAAH